MATTREQMSFLPKNTTLDVLSLHISIIPTLPGIRLFMKNTALPLIYGKPPYEVLRVEGGEEAHR